MKIDRDTFEEWLAHPITEALMKCCNVWADDAKQGWVNASWDGGQVDPLILAKLRERASVFRELSNITAEQIEEATT